LLQTVSYISSCGAQQRKARGKRTRKEAEEEDRDSEENSRAAEGGDAPRSARTGDVIRVQRRQARRRWSEPSAPNSSLIAGPAARSAARGIERGGKGSKGGRVTRSARGEVWLGGSDDIKGSFFFFFEYIFIFVGLGSLDFCRHWYL
jgi:hypothetical protein